MDRTVNEARESGYVETLSGRRRYFPDLNSGNQNLRGNAERAAINTPIQGTAADMIKLAMIRIDALLREKRPHKSLSQRPRHTSRKARFPAAVRVSGSAGRARGPSCGRWRGVLRPRWLLGLR